MSPSSWRTIAQLLAWRIRSMCSWRKHCGVVFQGECDSNYMWMSANCPLSCKLPRCKQTDTPRTHPSATSVSLSSSAIHQQQVRANQLRGNEDRADATLTISKNDNSFPVEALQRRYSMVAKPTTKARAEKSMIFDKVSGCSRRLANAQHALAIVVTVVFLV